MGSKYPKVLVISVLGIGMYVLGMKQYELFHVLVEGGLGVLGVLVFLLVLKQQNQFRSGFMVLIGVSFLYVAALSTIHLLAAREIYLISIKRSIEPRMIYLWTINNMIQSITFIIAVIIYKKDIKLSVMMACISYFLINSIFIYIWEFFPQSFVIGKGFSTFNLVIQIVNCLILILAIFIYIVRIVQDEKNPWADDLTNGMIVLIFSILSIILSTSKEDVFNIIGHLLRNVSAYYIIRFTINYAQQRSLSLEQ